MQLDFARDGQARIGSRIGQPLEVILNEKVTGSYESVEFVDVKAALLLLDDEQTFVRPDHVANPRPALLEHVPFGRERIEQQVGKVVRAIQRVHEHTRLDDVVLEEHGDYLVLVAGQEVDELAHGVGQALHGEAIFDRVGRALAMTQTHA